jgi:hypothetical protein
MKLNRYVIVRTENAGVFAGELVERRGNECDMVNARRLWYWDGAASLSGLAIHGTSKPANCKFPAAVSVTLLGVIEVIGTTDVARKSITEVPEWKA